MNKYKLIILDFDGTLCATHEAILFCIKKAYESLGKVFPNYDLTDKTIRAGLGMESTLRTLSPEFSDSEILKLLSNYENIYLQAGEQRSTPFPKAKEVIIKLYDNGFVLSVVSNKAIVAVDTALAYFGLKRYISLVVGDTKTLRKKPDPMAYNDFIKPKFNAILPKEILMVGDTPADLLFARNIGADSCWAEYGYGDPKTCRALKPNYIIKQLENLIDFLF